MDTSQVQPQASRQVQVPMFVALLNLLQQPTRKPQYATGNHRRSGITKNKSLGESKARRKMAKVSRARNRAK